MRSEEVRKNGGARLGKYTRGSRLSKINEGLGSKGRVIEWELGEVK